MTEKLAIVEHARENLTNCVQGVLGQITLGVQGVWDGKDDVVQGGPA